MKLQRLSVRCFYFVLSVLLCGSANAGQEASSLGVTRKTQEAIRLLVGEILVNAHSDAYDEYLADHIGPRLSGSDAYSAAASWAQRQFQSLGLANVHLESWTLPAAWQPSAQATGRIVAPVKHELHIFSMGWSPSTPLEGVEGEVVYVPSMEAVNLDAQRPQLAGAIAVIDADSFGAGRTADKIFPALSHLRSLGVQALLLAGGIGGTEVSDAENLSGHIDSVPEAQIGQEDMALIKRLLIHQQVRVQFAFANAIRRDVQVENVVAQISGAELPNEVVLVGAHLDSWQAGTGAQDNGTGVSMVLESARAMAELHRPPRRTVRFVLFGGEEQGLLGSAAYVRQHLTELKDFDVALVADSGSEPAKGWYLMGRDDEREALVELKPLLAGMGGDDVAAGTDFLFQSDHAPFVTQGVPSLVLWTPMDKYESLHHKASDTFDSVVARDLSLDSAVVAATAYAVADSPRRIAPQLKPAEVLDLLKASGHLDEYQFLHANGVLP